ncbi:SSU ribosomal protein S10P, partial [Giardia duodenalis]
VHAHRPGPCRAHVPPRSSETAQRRAVEGITWAALHRLLQLLIGTQRLARAALRGCRDAHCCGASLDVGFSSTRLADLCLCADAPRAVAAVSLAADGQSPGQPRQQEQELSLRPRAGLPRALHTLPHTQCSLSLAPGHTGRPAHSPLQRGSSARSPSAQHRLL